MTTTTKPRTSYVYTMPVLLMMVNDLNNMAEKAVRLRGGNKPLHKYALRTSLRGFRLVRVGVISGDYTEVLPWSSKDSIGKQLHAYTLGLETTL